MNYKQFHAREKQLEKLVSKYECLRDQIDFKRDPNSRKQLNLIILDLYRRWSKLENAYYQWEFKCNHAALAYYE